MTLARCAAKALKANATLQTLNLQVGFKAGAAGNAALRAVEAKLRRNASSQPFAANGGAGDDGSTTNLFAMAAAAVAPEQAEDEEEEDEEVEDNVRMEVQALPRARVRRQW